MTGLPAGIPRHRRGEVDTGMSQRQLSDQWAQRWAPDLGAARLVGGGHTAAILRCDAVVQSWCALDFEAKSTLERLSPNRLSRVLKIVNSER